MISEVKTDISLPKKGNDINDYTNCHSERQRRIFIVKMLHFVQHDSEGRSFSMIVRRIAIVGAMILSMRRYYFMEKAGYLSGLSIGRTVLMEKRRVLVGLSMERAYFVEEKEIAGRAGNDEKDQADNDGKVEPAMTEGDDEHKKSSRDFSLLL